MLDLMVGQVVDNIYEKPNGWVKVRIPQVHGLNSSDVSFTPDTMLPWAVPCSPFYTMYEAGTFIVPPIGSKLFLAEVDASPSYYVYLGGAYGISDTPQKYSLSPDKDNDSYSSTPGILAPRDVDGMKYGQSGVIFKSPKGHTIKYSDENGSEFFEIIDRSGQSIKMKCPVDSSKNKNNGASRGVSNTQKNGSIILTSQGSTVTIDNGNILEITDHQKVTVKSTVSELTPSSASLSAPSSIQITCGGSSISMTPSSITLQSPTVTITTSRATTIF